VVCGAASNKKFVVAQLRIVDLSALFSLRGRSSVRPLSFWDAPAGILPEDRPGVKSGNFINPTELCA
jgi:hypothetical protein